ncbi:hypothetical protein BF49_4699 [Bradyrhizobium sp.]|nr:hypothetical protein BF49_4699 [Bradyrhizobium sp.]
MSNFSPAPGYKLGDDARYKNLLGPGLCHNTSCRVNGDAADIAAHDLDFSCMQTRPQR